MFGSNNALDGWIQFTHKVDHLPKNHPIQPKVKYLNVELFPPSYLEHSNLKSVRERRSSARSSIVG